MTSGIVYKLTCSCGSTYIGHTRRNLLRRMKEHATLEKSKLCKHLIQHPTHRIDFNTPTILVSKNDTARLLLSSSPKEFVLLFCWWEYGKVLIT